MIPDKDITSIHLASISYSKAIFDNLKMFPSLFNKYKVNSLNWFFKDIKVFCFNWVKFFKNRSELLSNGGSETVREINLQIELLGEMAAELEKMQYNFSEKLCRFGELIQELLLSESIINLPKYFKKEEIKQKNNNEEMEEVKPGAITIYDI